MNARAFRLEVLVLVFLVGASATASARMGTARAKIGQLESALEFYRMDIGHYPTTAQGLPALLTPPLGLPSGAQYPEGGYLQKSDALIDPWGQPFQYQRPGTHHPESFDIWSMGSDRFVGGCNHAADVGNWARPTPSLRECPRDHPAIQSAVVGFIIFAMLFAVGSIPLFGIRSVQAALGRRTWRHIFTTPALATLGAIAVLGGMIVTVVLTLSIP
jgi:general secretion pathway protein G